MDACKTFCLRWRDEAGGHHLDDVSRDDAASGGVARLTDGDRDIEPDGFSDGAVLLSEGDPGLSNAAREIGGVDISHGAAEFETLAEEEAQNLEDSRVDGLIGFVVGDGEANGVGGERADTETGEVSRFAGAGEADGDDDAGGIGAHRT